MPRSPVVQGRVRNATSAEILTNQSVPEDQIGNQRRGINVYARTQTISVAALDKWGDKHSIRYEIPLFSLTLQERIDMARSCDMLFGAITTRMNQVSGLEWKVVTDTEEQDRQAAVMEALYGIYMDWSGQEDIKSSVVTTQISHILQGQLPTLLPDLSNFNRALYRWSRTEDIIHQSDSAKVEDWMAYPTQHDNFESWIKKIVFDLMVHGSAVAYKSEGLEHVPILPGGTIHPVRYDFANNVDGYLQSIDGFMPEVYYGDEVSYMQYVPTTAQSYGLVPLEALINKVAESLLFDELAANRADMTAPPEKLVVLGDHMPFGSFGAEFNVPLDPIEQKRIEQIVNEERKDAIRVLSGVGQPVVVDLSRSDIYAKQNERQKMLRESIGLVYNMSNMELNLTGSDSTSGRSTSEAQAEIEQNKGIRPIIKLIERAINKDLIPARFGPGYKFSFDTETSQEDQLRRATDMLKSGLYSVNEIRTAELGLDPYSGEQFDLPPGEGAQEEEDPLAALEGML